jgi:hypothetical protein
MWRQHAFWQLFTDFAMLNVLADTPAQRWQRRCFRDERELEHFHDRNLVHRAARIHQEDPKRYLEISSDPLLSLSF